MRANSNLPWSPSIKKLIEITMVLPLGSADAERGFSILKHASYDRRSLLKSQTIDAILRLRINGPDISEFDAFRYARLWEQEGHQLSDAASTTIPPKVTKSSTSERV